MGAEAAMIMLGASGLASGFLSSQSAKSNNQASLGFSKWSQLQAQEYNRQMYEKQLYDQKKMYEQYQSPQAIARQLAQAGLNPSAMSGSIGSPSIPSVPSGGSSSPVSAPHLENQGLALGQGIESIAKAASSFAGANVQDAQAKETRTLLQDKLNQLVLQNNGQELYNAKQDWDNYIAQKFGESDAAAKLNDLTADAYLKYSNGDNLAALTALNNIQQLIASEELGIKKEERANIGMLLLKQLSLLDSQINLNDEMAKSEPSKRSSNYASANLANHQASTEQYRTTVQRIEAEKVEKNKVALIKSFGQQLIRDNILSQSEQREFALNMARYQDMINARESDDAASVLDSVLDWLKDKASIFK